MQKYTQWTKCRVLMWKTNGAYGKHQLLRVNDYCIYNKQYLEKATGEITKS
jgi:hypothetical protein